MPKGREDRGGQHREVSADDGRVTERTAIFNAASDSHPESNSRGRRDIAPSFWCTAILGLGIVCLVFSVAAPNVVDRLFRAGGFTGTRTAVELGGSPTGAKAPLEEAMSSPTDGRREALLSSARALCDAFASKAPLDTVLDTFSAAHDDDIVCLEHGLGLLAPFLGREFRGRAGARRYFEMIAELLTYEDMSFDGYAVDEEVGLVSVVGKGRFTWKSTGKSWDEVFTYRLKFDNEAKVTSYEVWADSGAAYLASKGEL